MYFMELANKLKARKKEYTCIIDKLRQLHNKLSETEGIRKPDKIGGGNTIEKLEDLSTLYSEICNALKEQKQW